MQDQLQALMSILMGAQQQQPAAASPLSAPMGAGAALNPMAAAPPAGAAVMQAAPGRPWYDPNFPAPQPDPTPVKQPGKKNNNDPKNRPRSDVEPTPLQRYRRNQRESVKDAVTYGPSHYSKIMQTNLGLNEPTPGYGGGLPTSNAFTKKFTDLFTGDGNNGPKRIL